MTEQKAETLSQELSQVLEEIVTTPEERSEACGNGWRYNRDD